MRRVYQDIGLVVLSKSVLGERERLSIFFFEDEQARKESLKRTWCSKKECVHMGMDTAGNRTLACVWAAAWRVYVRKPRLAVYKLVHGYHGAVASESETWHIKGRGAKRWLIGFFQTAGQRAVSTWKA
jgi:hypothetical protein